MFSELLSDAKTFLVLLFISILIIIMDNYSIFNIPKSFFQSITVPIQFGLYKTGINVGKQFEFIILARRASQENKALKEQIASILSENSFLRKRVGELESLTEQEQSLNSQTFNLISARPIGISRFLYIDKGSDDGLKPDQAVVYKDNFIGLIKEVTPKKSKVLLAQDPDSAISAFSGTGENKARGVLVGQFGAEMLFDKILHKEEIKVGDLVYSEGAEIEIPKGLVLGQVSEILGQDNEVFKQAKVKQVFDITDLDLVFVITN